MDTKHPDMGKAFESVYPTAQNIQVQEFALFFHDVVLDTVKSDYWNDAVKEWAAYSRYDVGISPVEGTNGAFVQYSLSSYEACLDFLIQMYGHAFDTEARKIEQAAAGVEIWKDDDTHPWIATSAAPAGQNMKFDDPFPSSSTVVLRGTKTDNWHLAVAEWSKYTNHKVTSTCRQAGNDTFSEFEFDELGASLDFCKQASIHAFDVEAKEIERHAAGIKLEQAASPIAWAPSRN